MDAVSWTVEHVATVSSTNEWLLERARDGAPEGLVILADAQTQGRGRLGRSWSAPAGSSLLCSFLLRPRLAVDDLHVVVVAVALATRAALGTVAGRSPTLKWPNDLLYGDQKVAGILAETVGEDGDRAVVVGLGLNVRDAPDLPGATSLLEATGASVVDRVLLDTVLGELAQRYALVASEAGRESLRREYRSCLATLGQLVRVERFDDSVTGRADDVDAVGRLCLTTSDGPLVLSVGDVVHLRREDQS